MKKHALIVVAIFLIAASGFAQRSSRTTIHNRSGSERSGTRQNSTSPRSVRTPTSQQNATSQQRGVSHQNLGHQNLGSQNRNNSHSGSGQNQNNRYSRRYQIVPESDRRQAIPRESLHEKYRRRFDERAQDRINRGRHGPNHGGSFGRYYYGGSWHSRPDSYQSSHNHGSGCGHHQYGDNWYSSPSHGIHDHIHRPGCGHHYYGGSWHVYQNRHVHNKGCGHHYFSGSWHLYPQAYGDRSHFYHYYYSGIWGLFPGVYSGYGQYEVTREDTRESETERESGAPKSGREFFKSGDYYAAIVRFDREIRDGDASQETYLLRSLAFVAVRQYDDAYDDMEGWIRREPEWLSSPIDLFSYYGNGADLEEHLSELAQWRRQQRRHWRAAFLEAMLWYLNGDYERAEASTRAAMDAQANNALASLLLDAILSGSRNAATSVD